MGKYTTCWTLIGWEAGSYLISSMFLKDCTFIWKYDV